MSRSLNLAKTHSTMSSLLLEAGAILYVKTTTPQAQLSFDTDSPLWGRTVNPHNTALTAGGSTGGEGALIAMRGSIMGLGTDMGGSVRIPAACCGIFAIKPTSRRIPRTGTETIEVPGGSYVGLPISCGPLAHSASDCKWFLKVIAETQPWRFDAQVTPYTFASPDRGGKPLKIGIFIDNGISSPLPPVAAMFDEVRHVLAEAGHELELIALPGYSKAFEVALGFIKMSGSDLFFDALEILGNEPLSPWLSRMKRSSVKPHALEEFYKLSHVKENTEASILNGLWERGAKKNRLDVIICPISGHPTPKHDHWTTMDWTAVWALIDYPAGVGSNPVSFLGFLKLIFYYFRPFPSGM